MKEKEQKGEEKGGIKYVSARQSTCPTHLIGTTSGRGLPFWVVGSSRRMLRWIECRFISAQDRFSRLARKSSLQSRSRRIQSSSALTPGADGRFQLYGDEGDNYDDKKSEHSLIPITWSQADKALFIGARVGSYPGMQARLLSTPSGYERAMGPENRWNRRRIVSLNIPAPR